MEPAAVSIFQMKKDQSGLKQHSASKCVMQDTKMVNSGGKVFGHLLHLWYPVLYNGSVLILQVLFILVQSTWLKINDRTISICLCASG